MRNTIASNAFKPVVLSAVVAIVAFCFGTVSTGVLPGTAEASSHTFQEITRYDITEIHNQIDPPLTKGPEGLTTRTPSELELTEGEKEKIRGMNLNTVYLISTPDVTEILNKQGADEVLENVGQSPVEFLGGESLEAQLNQLESIRSQPGRYDFIMAQPFGQKATANSFMNIANAGVPIVFAWTSSAGIEKSDNYLGLVLDDGYGRGYASAKMLAKAIGGEGRVGMINFAVEFFSTDQRTMGAHAAFDEFEGIEVVDERGFSSPSKAGDVARGMLRSNPDLDAIWAVWMDPVAYQVSDAAKDLGRAGDIVITSTDLGGEAGAKRIASEDDPIIGTVDANSVQMGRNMARIGLKYMAGNKDILKTFAPVAGYPIAEVNLEKGFQFSQQKSLPADIREMID